MFSGSLAGIHPTTWRCTLEAKTLLTYHCETSKSNILHLFFRPNLICYYRFYVSEHCLVFDRYRIAKPSTYKMS
jgi:hypothetical protein